MNKAEALEFLELAEYATEPEIKTRISEKLVYYELLSEKAPSAFLRRIHAQNVSKIKLLQSESLQWKTEIPVHIETNPPSSENIPVIIQPESVPEIKKEEIIPVPEQPVEPVIAIEPEPAPVIKPDKISEIAITPQAEIQPVPESANKIDSVPENIIKLSEVSIPSPEPINEPDVIPEAIKSITPPPEPIIEKKIEPAPAPQEMIPTILPVIEPSKTPAINPSPPVENANEKLRTTTFIPTGEWASAQRKPKPAPEPVAWLVRHTENLPSKSFPVFPGKNFIGRKQQQDLRPFIPVEEDPFVSRVHAALYAEGTGIYQFYITDSSASNGGKPSKNGTYVNGNEERINTKVKLNDRDTIQIGVSKFVLRNKFSNLKTMIKEVEESDFMHTVVIDPNVQ